MLCEFVDVNSENVIFNARSSGDCNNWLNPVVGKGNTCWKPKTSLPSNRCTADSVRTVVHWLSNSGGNTTEIHMGLDGCLRRALAREISSTERLMLVLLLFAPVKRSVVFEEEFP